MKNVKKNKSIVENRLKKGTYLNFIAWTADITVFTGVNKEDDFELFSVLSLPSKAILGYAVGKSITANDIAEVLKGILNGSANYQKARFFHVDGAAIFMSNVIQKTLKENGIEFSRARSESRMNQNIESYHNTIKRALTLKFFEKIPARIRNKELKECGLKPVHLKQNNIRKACSKDVRSVVFKTESFTRFLLEELDNCVEKYNKDKGVIKSFYCSRNEHEFLLRYVDLPDYQGDQKTSETQAIKAYSEFGMQKAHNTVQDLFTKENKPVSKQNAENLVENVLIDLTNPQELLTSFVGLLKCFEFSYQQNYETQGLIKEQTNILTLQNKELLRKIELIQRELDERKALDELAKEKQLKRKNRKRRPPTSLLTHSLFLKFLRSTQYDKKFTTVRARLATVLLYITGLRISEILHLTLKTLNGLFVRKKPYFVVPWLKNKKGMVRRAYITNRGKEVTSIVRSDYIYINNCLNKDKNAYIFSPQNKPNKLLTREYFTREVNRFVKVLDEKMSEDGTMFSSHGFRKRQITNLWKDSGDIE
jgi:site-specific recombinase XerD